jgi:hypothetical protein
MSKLETANIPLVGCLAQDISTPLDMLQQFTIAQWAMKTTMAFASINLTTHGGWFTLEERHGLRALSRLPVRSSVWLGRYSGSGRIGSESHTIQYAIPGDGIADGYACTLLVGHLMLQVFALHVPVEKEDHRTPFGVPWNVGDWERLLVQIFPSRIPLARWPPPDSISNFNVLAGRFSLSRAVRAASRRRPK